MRNGAAALSLVATSKSHYSRRRAQLSLRATIRWKTGRHEFLERDCRRTLLRYARLSAGGRAPAHKDRPPPRPKKAVMADDPSKRGPQDRSRTNTSDGYKVRYWSRKCGLSPEKLKAAVEEVGTAPKRQSGR